MRKLLPFLAAILLAFLVAAGRAWLDLSEGVVYALAGFFLGVLLCLGIPFAFGVSPLGAKDGKGLRPPE